MLPGVTTLSESLIRALGPRTGKPLEEIFGLRTVGDLLRHYPRRYYTRGELTDLSSLREGDHVTVLARVVTVAEIPLPPMPGKGRRSRLEVVVTDDRAKLVLTFFSGLGRYRRVLGPTWSACSRAPCPASAAAASWSTRSARCCPGRRPTPT